MPIRILHVEDEPDIREVVEVSLGLDPDFVTQSCDSGQKALAAAVDWTPDIILLDVMMPVMDGPTTLARLRDHERTANIPVVFMTACAQACELDMFRSLGIAGVIPKPFNPMTLAASVRIFMKPLPGRLGPAQSIFLQRVHDDAVTLADHRAVLKEGALTPATLARIKDIAHGLAGAGGIFGYPAISEAASELAEAVAVELHGTGSIDEIEHTLDRLLKCVDASCICQIPPSHSRVDA